MPHLALSRPEVQKQTEVSRVRPMGFVFFGLTGGIATGKSTVARFMREQGLAIIDADLVARQVVQKGSDGLRDIVQNFGGEVLSKDGELDRKALGRMVFSDEQARRRLNEITHPRIRDEATRQAQQYAREGHELIAYEAALLVEAGLADKYRPLVLVVCDEATQLERLKARDGYSTQEAQARIAAQMALAEKRRYANLVIDTGASLEEVRRGSIEVLWGICRACEIDVGRYKAETEGVNELTRTR